MKKFILFLVLGSLMLFLVTCASVQNASKYTDPAYVTDVMDIKGYIMWPKVNQMTITGDTSGSLGPAHEGVQGFREIYINITGLDVSLGRVDFPYPAGTIVVKEAFADKDGAKGDLASITVMIKRGDNYDPDNGNWEYMMLSPAYDVAAQGKVDMCIGCHAVAKDKDWVFNNRM